MKPQISEPPFSAFNYWRVFWLIHFLHYFQIYELYLMGLYRISFLLLLCLPFSELSGQVKISGKIKHPIDTVVTLIVPPTNLGGESQKVSVPVSAGDKFSITIKTQLATPAVIAHGGSSIPIFIIPDQSFSLEFTISNKEAREVRFTGPDAADNAFFHNYLQFLKVKTPPLDSIQLARSTAKEYRRLMDQKRAARERFLASYAQSAENELAPHLLQWLRDDIAYTCATQLLRYPSVFQDLHKGTKSRTPSASYYSFLNSIRINNPEAILLDSYQRFLESFLTYKMEKPMRWEFRTGGERQYSLLSRFLFGSPLYYMQQLVFERTLQWLVDPDYLAEEYQAFMRSEAPELLKDKLRRLKESPPKVYSMKSFSIIGSPLLYEVFQLQNGKRLDSTFFKGRPSLLYFHDRRLSRGDFIIRYLKKLRRNLDIHPEMNICLVDVNGDFNAWQKLYAKSGYANHPVTHLSLNYFDELFDTRIEQGSYPNMLVANPNGIIIERLDWKPSVKQVLEIINRLP